MLRGTAVPSLRCSKTWESLLSSSFLLILPPLVLSLCGFPAHFSSLPLSLYTKTLPHFYTWKGHWKQEKLGLQTNLKYGQKGSRRIFPSPISASKVFKGFFLPQCTLKNQRYKGILPSGTRAVIFANEEHKLKYKTLSLRRTSDQKFRRVDSLTILGMLDDVVALLRNLGWMEYIEM